MLVYTQSSELEMLQQANGEDYPDLGGYAEGVHDGAMRKHG